LGEDLLTGDFLRGESMRVQRALDVLDAGGFIAPEQAD